MEPKILVSVIVPVRNVEKYITEAIESVKNQTEKRWELIIVDDASEDMTPAICRKYADIEQIRYIRSDVRLGVSKARNMGLDVASGDYIVFMDGDDVLPENSLALRVELMKSADMVFGGHLIMGEADINLPDGRVGEYTDKQFWERIKFFQARKCVGIEFVWDKIFSRHIINENQLRFREDMNLHEDLFWVMDYIDLINRYYNRVRVIKEVVYIYRNHEGSSSKAYDRNHFDRLKILFARIRCELENKEIFCEEIKEGVYHGYVNKTIGQLYAFVKNENITVEKINYIKNMLCNDKDLQYGLSNYVCKNQYEDEKIIILMREHPGGGGAIYSGKIRKK